MRVTVIDHPLVAERLADIRHVDSDRPAFRTALEELGSMLVYEACREYPTLAVTVDTPLGPAAARRLAHPPVLVPVLRAGIGLLHPALQLLPYAEVAFIGVTRDETTFLPDEYVVKIPANLSGRTCLILDPMLATGGSLAHTARLLIRRGVDTTILVVCALAAPEGLALLEESGLDLHVITAAIDERLNERRYIVPGLGDAGDRQFGVPYNPDTGPRGH
jgi:uracil phosphoribosyltransferase